MSLIKIISQLSKATGAPPTPPPNGDVITQLAGLERYYDVINSVIVKDGSNLVSSISDLSIVGYDATQETAINKPLQDVDGGINFGGSDVKLLDINYIGITRTYAITFIIDYNGLDSNKYIMFGSVGGFIVTTDRVYLYDNSTNYITSTVGLIPNGKQVITWQRNSSGADEVYWNGNLIATSASGRPTTGQFELQNWGAITTNSNEQPMGKMYHLSFMGRTMTGIEIASVHNYLKTIHSIQ